MERRVRCLFSRHARDVLPVGRTKLGSLQRVNPCPVVQTLVSTRLWRWPKDVSLTKVVEKAKVRMQSRSVPLAGKAANGGAARKL